jgi:hypothetical protein
MPAIYHSATEAINAALMMSFIGHPNMNLNQVDHDRVVVRESMIVCQQGIGKRFTTIYRDISGRYVGFADYVGVQQDQA